jgi:hypothetical protein
MPIEAQSATEGWKMRAKFMLSASAIAISLPAYAADVSSGYIPPSGDPVYSPQPMVTGHLDLGIGPMSVDFDGGSENVTVFVGAGRANIPFSGGAWNIELETGGGSIFNSDFSYSTIGTAAHLWTRFGGGALGVYGAANFPTGATIGTVGAEVEGYLGAITLGANADYNWGDGFDFWTVRGEADAYVTPDFRVGGELSFISADGTDAWGAALDTEYRFTGTPLSVWAEGAYTSFDSGGPEIWAGLLGVRVFMDPAGSTLESHDREVPWDSGLLGNRLVLFGG